MPIKSFKEYIKEYRFGPNDRESTNVDDRRGGWSAKDVESFLGQDKSDPKPPALETPKDIVPDRHLGGPKETIIPKTTPGIKQRKVKTQTITKSIVPPKPKPAKRPMSE